MITLINYADATFADAQRYNSKTAKSVGKIDVVKEYNPKDIDEAYISKYAKWFVVGDAQIGKYCLWRPYIIKKEYEQLQEGDFLMYTDSGTYFVNDVHHLTKFMEKKQINVFVCELPFVEKYWTKRDVFEVLDGDSDEIVNSNQRMSTAFIIRKSNEGAFFVNKYFELAINYPELYTDEDNKMGKANYDGFVQNRHNQSVLSVLTKKMGITAYRDITEYGFKPRLYSFYDIPRYTFRYNKYPDSIYPQILVQHRRGKVTKVVRLFGWVRSKMPYICGWFLISLSRIKQTVRISRSKING